MSVEQDLKYLDELNDTLNKIVQFAENSLSIIDDFKDDTPERAQEQIDNICEKVSDKATEKLNQARNRVVDILQQKYTSASKTVSELKPVVETQITDLDSVITVLTNIVALYTKPYRTALEYTVGFIDAATPKLLEITKKINELRDIKTKISTPDELNINLDKLNITMQPISIEDITSK